jgi:hypothetical protein
MQGKNQKCALEDETSGASAGLRACIMSERERAEEGREGRERAGTAEKCAPNTEEEPAVEGGSSGRGGELWLRRV